MARPLESSAEAVEARTDPERERSFALPPGRVSSGRRLLLCVLGALLAARGATSLPPTHRPAGTPANSRCNPSSKMVSDLS